MKYRKLWITADDACGDFAITPGKAPALLSRDRLTPAGGVWRYAGELHPDDEERSMLACGDVKSLLRALGIEPPEPGYQIQIEVREVR